MQPSDVSAPQSAAVLNAGDLLNETEAAAFLGTKRATMANWRWRGVGPRFVKAGQKLVRYRRADLLSFVEAGDKQVTS